MAGARSPVSSNHADPHSTFLCSGQSFQRYLSVKVPLLLLDQVQLRQLPSSLMPTVISSITRQNGGSLSCDLAGPAS
jgi:hypothetical protein